MTYLSPQFARTDACPRAFGRERGDDSSIARALDGRVPYGDLVRYIGENLARRITVEELARVAALSVFQLARVLRREHATTPYGLVLAIRVEHAKARLRNGATIVETAIQAGFADQSHLTRHFKRLTGMTPKQYCAQ